MEKLSNSLNNFINLMDQNIRGVQVRIIKALKIVSKSYNYILIRFQIGCYSVALVSLTIALRKVRPVSYPFIKLL